MFPNGVNLTVVLVVVGIAAIGSLFACRNWPARISFTLAMPVIYGLIWWPCALVAGIFTLILTPRAIAEPLAMFLSVSATFGIFVVHVMSMRRDLPGTFGYSPYGRGKRGIEPPGESLLPEVPSRRPWMR